MKLERLDPADHPYDWATSIGMSLGVKADNLVFLSGQVALEDGKVVGEGDIEAQTRMIYETIETLLREAGGGMRNLVKLDTYYVYDGDEAGVNEYYNKMTRVRQEFIQEPGPAGTAVRIHGLSVPGLLIEVDAIAVLDS